MPEWRMIYEGLLEQADFGDLITFQALAETLDRPFEGNRSPLYRARSEMGDRRKRWLEAVPGVGYRVVEAREHLRLANSHKRRAKNQLKAMVHVAEVTDLARLNPDELATYDAQTKINGMLFLVAVHHEQRIARLEDVLRREGML